MTTPEQWTDFLKKHATALAADSWSGAAGASDAQLQHTEKRLGLKLPPSYRAFLQASNGWSQASRSVPILRNAEALQWFRKLHRDWIQAYQYSEPLDLPEAEYFDYANCDPVQFDPKHLQHTLCISEIGDDAVILLNPMVVWPDGEWETWFFANWLPGAERFRRFSDWFKHAHSELSDAVFSHDKKSGDLPTVYLDPPSKANRRIRPREKIYDIQSLLKQLSSKKPATRRTAAKRLGRIRRRESFEALRQLIETEEDHYVRMEIIGSIGRIGSDTAVEFLKPYVDDAELGSDAAHAIATNRSETATEFVLTLLAKAHQHAPVTAYPLSARNENRAIPLLEKLLTETEFQSHRHRPHWGGLIAGFGNAQALEALRNLTTHHDKVVRRSALDGLTLLAFNAAKQASLKAEARLALEDALRTESDLELRTFIESSLDLLKGPRKVDSSPFT